MMKNERDQSIERLLHDTLRTTTSSAAGRCLDAETAAAWAEETLGRVQRSAAEAHAADCARCQALLAAMVRTNPPAAARSWWRAPAIRYLIPLTAAAAGVMVWAILPSRTQVEPNSRAIAAVGTVATAADPPAAERSVTVKPTTIAPSGINAPLLPRVSRRDLAIEKPQRAAQSSAPLAPGFGSFPPSAAAVLAAPPEQAAARAVTAQTSARALVLTDTVIVSPNPAIRWRIVPGGTVHHSSDGGSSWQMQQTGATVTLNAGASPSSSVCWIVGPGGIVLLSSDGRTWQRVRFPEMTDLVSIRAADDKTAFVTSSDGRTFSTTDGGLTWMRSPKA